MKTSLNRFSGLLVMVFLSGFLACNSFDQADFNAPLFDNLGEYSMKTTMGSEYSQRFFNQGLILAYAFNHREAERSFQEAIRLDSSNAMAYWGASHVLGTNYITAMDEASQQKAWHLSQKASALIENGENISEWEKEIVKATQIRFSYGEEKNQKQLDIDYAEAMRKLYHQFPDHDDVAVLFAESLMNIHPGDLYSKKGIAKPWTAEIENVLETVLVRNPQHPGANHFYILSVEASNRPERGLPSADRLVTLVPGSSQLVHTASHIYWRLGDYNKAREINELALKTDSLYVMKCKGLGVDAFTVFPHTTLSLVTISTFEGRGEKAINAAFEMASFTDTTLIEKQNLQSLQQYYSIIPYYLLVKFGQWDKILSLKKPEIDLGYPTATWHYARGMAFVGKGKLEEAHKELQQLEKIKGNAEPEKETNMELNSTDQLLQIASYSLKAKIAQKKGDNDEGIEFLTQAMELEDQMTFSSDWFFSVKHDLGALLLNAEQYEEAQQVYENDLSRYPKNGWALNGLYNSLVHQDKLMEALEVMEHFELVWKNADVELETSVVKPVTYKNIREYPIN
ncbi:hypothetical protein JKA74_14040 [Marivirga sp. S37H4]|uniref:Tetratricopeptide repeat protein n=1 Tax=Marivirga aurantiaca TaxID=2802615 RepID=A0A934X0L2_9BACT|nr:hypothetical protein [Marivirga aurantiaca]MBK6266161.1 hypothetical protein [Marivirga aurantiaca]